MIIINELCITQAVALETGSGGRPERTVRLARRSIDGQLEPAPVRHGRRGPDHAVISCSHSTVNRLSFVFINQTLPATLDDGRQQAPEEAARLV